MKISKKDWPLSSVYGIRQRINTNPDFQRPAVWGLAQKQLLIDTILRDYDVPKLYWRKTGSKPDTYDVVDGQQRLRKFYTILKREMLLQYICQFYSLSLLNHKKKCWNIWKMESLVR